VECDLSWGGWTALEGAASPAPYLPQLERRKLLLSPAGGRASGELGSSSSAILARFVGFGATGREKAQFNRRLAAAGYAPPVVGYAHGMLLQAWCAHDWRSAPARPARPPIDVAARYYAHLRRHYACDAADAARRDQIVDLTTTVESIARAWFGDPRTAGIQRAADQLQDLLPLRGDQRPEPVEWIVRNGVTLKCDGGDHYLDHTWARSQDICFDLAGFILDFALTQAQQRALIESYVRQSGDIHATSRLPFFRMVYAAHRLAALDTAYHAGRDEDRPRLERERGRMAEALDVALRADGVAGCAS
jgi:hypothetical protein